MFTKDKWHAIRDAFAEVAVKSGKFKVKKVTDKKITLTRPDTPGLKEAVLMLVGPGNLYWTCTTLDGVSGSQVWMYSRAAGYDMPSYVSLKPHLSVPATRKWVWEGIAADLKFAKEVAESILHDVESASRNVIRTDVYSVFVDAFTVLYASLKGAQKIIRKGDRVYYPTGDPEKAYIYIGDRSNDGDGDFMNIYSARDTSESGKKLLVYVNMRVAGSDSNSQLLAGAKHAFNSVFNAKIRESIAGIQNQAVPKNTERKSPVVKGLESRYDMGPTYNSHAVKFHASSYAEPLYYEVLGTNLDQYSYSSILEWLEKTNKNLLPGKQYGIIGEYYINSLDWNSKENAWIIKSLYYFKD